MKTLSAKHRIYLLFRQGQAEESMISFIRDKLIRKGCSVIQDVTESTMVLVLLTPGVFEFIDAPDDKVYSELVYVLRRYDKYRVLGILCDLFKWPDSIHLPDDILSLKSCDTIEWSPENRNAFMKCLFERIDPSLLDIASCPTSPRTIYEDEEEPIWNGGEGRNGVSTQAQNEEEVGGNFRRTGSAFYFDELNEHVERKSEVPVGRKRKPKITAYSALGSPSDQGRLEETSDDTDPDESYDMNAYKPPELPGTEQTSASPVGESQAYKPPEVPKDVEDPSVGSDSSDRAIASPELPVVNGDEPDSYGSAELRRKRSDTYEPPDLPLDEDVHAEIVVRRRIIPSPNGATATIRPRSGERKSIYVPPPSPPCLESPEHGRNEIDAMGAFPGDTRGTVPRSGTTTVTIEGGDPVGSPGTSQNRSGENQRSGRHNGEVRPEPERTRPQSLPPPPRSSTERGVDTAILRQNPYRDQRFTQSLGTGFPTNRPDLSRSEKKSTLSKFLHRKTFTLPKDSEIRYGRYPDEHPYWNAGKYTKFNLDDEFCDESYFANKRNTLPRMSVRVSRRNSSRRPSAEPEKTSALRSGRSASVTVLNETTVHRFVPEVEQVSDEASEDVEARKKDAGSTPVSGRKTYEPVEEYRPPAEPEVIEEPVVFVDEYTATPSFVTFGTPAEHNINKNSAGHNQEPLEPVVEKYRPPREPQPDQEALASEENSTQATEYYTPPAKPRSTETIVESAEPTQDAVAREYRLPPYDIDTHIVPDHVVLPPPRQHILINYPQIEENAPPQAIEPLVDQDIYVQQLLPPRRLPPLVSPSELTTTVPDVRIAAQWSQVEVDELQRRSLPVIGSAGETEYQPPPLPTTEVESEIVKPHTGKPPSPAPRKIPANSEAEHVHVTPAVMPRYRPPEVPSHSALKSEPLAYRNPVIDAESKPEPRLRREIPVHAPHVPRTDVESKLQPIAHHAAANRDEETPSSIHEAQGSYKPPPIPEDFTIPRAQAEHSTTGHKAVSVPSNSQDVSQRNAEPEQEPQVSVRRLEPILRTVAAWDDPKDAASFSKQNIKTDSPTQSRMDYQNGSTVVGVTGPTRPISLKRPLRPEDETTPFTPPNSYTETEATIHENFRRAHPSLYQEPPMPEPVPVPPPRPNRKPAIPREFSRSLLSPEAESYQPPPMPTAPIPESNVAKQHAYGFLDEQRRMEPIAHRAEDAPASSSTTVTTFYPTQVPLNDKIEDKDKTQSPTLSRESQPVSYEQAFRARQEPTPTYVPPRLPVRDDVQEEGRISPVASIKPPPAYKQNNSNDGDDEEEDDTRRAPNQLRKPVIDPEIELREDWYKETSHAPTERRTRSVIEVSQSTMEPVTRRRVNSLDPRLTGDLREYVERHVCDRRCCKIVCPKRLAENIDNLHYVDEVRILTNLDVLGRRRLSYLLAIEAKRYVSHLDSKFITAAGAEEGSKTPDSGCEPSSKVSGGDSDATLSDGEFVSEEAIARELAKIEKIRRRNAQFQENGVIPPPQGFDVSDRHQVYQSSERTKNAANRTHDTYQAPPVPNDTPNVYQPPPLPPSESASTQSDRSMQAQDTYRRPELPGYESSNGIPSNPAAKEALKNIIEGRIVFEPHSRRTAHSNEQPGGDAMEAYNTWHRIWRNVKREEVPALSGHEILSLFGVMRHILGTKFTLPEVRNDLRTIIQKNGMGLSR